MTKQDAIIIMLPNYVDERDDWDKIEKTIDFCSDLYDKIHELYPADSNEIVQSHPEIEEEIDTDDEIEDIFEEKEDDSVFPISKIEERIKTITSSPTITSEQAEFMKKAMAKQNQYVEFEELKEEPKKGITNKGSIINNAGTDW